MLACADKCRTNKARSRPEHEKSKRHKIGGMGDTVDRQSIHCNRCGLAARVSLLLLALNLCRLFVLLFYSLTKHQRILFCVWMNIRNSSISSGVLVGEWTTANRCRVEHSCACEQSWWALWWALWPAIVVGVVARKMCMYWAKYFSSFSSPLFSVPHAVGDSAKTREVERQNSKSTLFSSMSPMAVSMDAIEALLSHYRVPV